MGWTRRRKRAQGTVEAALVMAALAAVLALALGVAWWGHAQGVLTAAVQDGARVASTYGGNATHGLRIARQLLRAGLGKSERLVDLQVRQDAGVVTFTARGRWPVVVGPGVEVSFPLGAEARVRRERWLP